MIGREGWLLMLAGGLLASCGGNADQQALPNNNAAPSLAENVAEPDAVPPRSSVDNAASPAASAIPAAFQGRWGMVPNDCQPGRADAKGLLVITGDTLKFYESSGTVGVVDTRQANRFVADFAMMGEGMEWKRRMGFDLSNGGKTLVRTESGAEAPYEPVTYQRCP